MANVTNSLVPVYVGSSTSGKLPSLHTVLADAETGALRLAGGVMASDTTYLAVNRAHTRLYASCSRADFGGTRANGGVAVYALGADGMPGACLDAVRTTRGAPCHVSLAPDERTLVFAEYGQGTAGWVRINPDGTFEKDSRGVVVSSDPTGPNKPRQDRPHCHCARVTPDGKYVCVVDLGTDRVKVYDRATGRFLRDVVTTPAGAGPRHLAFHPNGRFAYLLFELSNLVTAFSYQDGVLTPLQQLSLLPEGFTAFSKAAAIKLVADGALLLCTNRGHDSLAVFTVDAGTGLLARRAILPFGGSFPWDFAVLPGGRILVAGLEKEGALRSYRFNPAEATLEPVATVGDLGNIFCTAC